jgi:hypothetical protein
VGERAVAERQATDRVASHHRQQLQRYELLALENLAAHDQFCRHIEDYVKDGENERSADHQQRVTDYAGYVRLVYEGASVRSLEEAIRNAREALPREVQVVRTVYVAQPQRRSWLSRLFIGQS